jgi:hypothetical protein
MRLQEFLESRRFHLNCVLTHGHGGENELTASVRRGGTRNRSAFQLRRDLGSWD